MEQLFRISTLMLIAVLAVPGWAAAQETLKYKHFLSLYSDERGAALSQPEGVGCSENTLAVADSKNGRLVLYTIEEGEPKGGREVKLPQILYPRRVAISPAGDIFVQDGRQRKVARLAPDGAFKDFIQTGGSPTEGMVVPGGMDFDEQGNLYLLDVLGGRVLVFDAEGKKQRQVNFPKTYGFITDLAVDRKGNLFLLDGVQAVLMSADASGTFTPLTASLKGDIRFGSHVTRDGKGQFFISDQNSGGIVVVNPDGTVRTRLLVLGWKEGQVLYPSQVCVRKEGYLFVADRANNRVQVFTPLK